MYEVKVYDSSGNLKNVITVDQLNIRSNLQMETPSIFRRDKRTGRPSGKFLKNQANERKCSKE